MLNFFRNRSKQNLNRSGSQGKLPVTQGNVQYHQGPHTQQPLAAAENVDIELPKELPKVGLDDFDLLKVLGKGGFGKVMLVRKKGTEDIYAMKVLKKEAVIKRQQVAHTKTETKILKQIRHPFLTRMYFGAPPSPHLTAPLTPQLLHFTNADRQRACVRARAARRSLPE